MKTMRTIINRCLIKSSWLLLFCALSPVYFSQPLLKESKSKSQDWEVLFESANCKIQYKYAVCDMRMDGIVKEEVYLKFSNESDKVVAVSWDLELVYGTTCYNCNGENEELSYQVVINPGETVEGKCGDYDQNLLRLKIFSKFMNGESKTQLSDFNLKNIRINALK